MAVRIGTNPIAWSNDDLRDLGRDTPLETCLREAATAGYRGIELGHKFPREARALGEVLNAHGLELVSGWYSSFLCRRSVADEISALQDHMTLLKKLGCGVIVWAECTDAIHGDRAMPLSRRPKLSARDFTRFSDKLTQVADYVAEQGMALAYHHHMGTVVESEADVDRLMAATGESVGLLLDTGHIALAGGDPGRVLAKHHDRIRHFHAKDIRAGVAASALRHDSSFLNAVLDGVFTVPGDGSIDYLPLFEGLRAAGYDGWIVVEAEQDPAKANPFTYAKKGYDHLTRVLTQAGLVIATEKET